MMDASASVRRTRQRAAVASALAELDGFASAQEIHSRLESAGVRVGLTTVYRTLQGMALAGEVDIVRSDGEARYRQCDLDDHHHHLVCRQCGRAVEIGNKQLERWTNATARRHGFTEVTHQVEVFGRCPTCSRA
jgi:Fur family ferric uptake transcriptional regulator